jgi:uncharacterized protein (DUF1015 family)
LAEVSEFKGVRYNPEAIHYMADVICPPYDVISPQEQEAFYERSEYNFVRIEHALDQQGDDDKHNKYTRSRDSLNQWLKDRVLIQDTVPNYYVHEHSFEIGETKRRRLGIMACVRLEPWEKKIIFPHEFTMSGVKEERLKLMKACHADCSPIFGLYEDPGNKINQIILNRVKSRPTYSFDYNGDSHRFWAVNEPEFVQRVSHFLIPKPIYIADGHHRYETALVYRDYRRQHDPHAPASASFNYVMMTLVSFSDPGIVILPIHRLVKGISGEGLNRLRKGLSEYFQIVEAPAASVSIDNKHLGSIKIYGLAEGKMLGLNLLPKTRIKDMVKERHSEAYFKLDVSAVQHIIVEKLLGLDANSTDKLAYTPSGDSACRLVEEGQYQFAILLQTIPAITIKTVADAGDRMPRKSTYFYPKLPSGLVVFRTDGEI